MLFFFSVLFLAFRNSFLLREGKFGTVTANTGMRPPAMLCEYLGKRNKIAAGHSWWVGYVQGSGISLDGCPQRLLQSKDLLVGKLEAMSLWNHLSLLLWWKVHWRVAERTFLMFTGHHSEVDNIYCSKVPILRSYQTFESPKSMVWIVVSFHTQTCLMWKTRVLGSLKYSPPRALNLFLVT